jgi:hypothetical protein
MEQFFILRTGLEFELSQKRGRRGTEPFITTKGKKSYMDEPARFSISIY